MNRVTCIPRLWCLYSSWQYPQTARALQPTQGNLSCNQPSFSTPLHYAATAGDLDTIENLLTAGSGHSLLDHADSSNTPIGCAAREGHRAAACRPAQSMPHCSRHVWAYHHCMALLDHGRDACGLDGASIYGGSLSPTRLAVESSFLKVELERSCLTYYHPKSDDKREPIQLHIGCVGSR